MNSLGPGDTYWTVQTLLSTQGPCLAIQHVQPTGFWPHVPARDGEVKADFFSSLGPMTPICTVLVVFKGVEPPWRMCSVPGLGVEEALPTSNHLSYVPWLPAQGGDGSLRAVPWSITGYPPCVCTQAPAWGQRRQQALSEGKQGSHWLGKWTAEDLSHRWRATRKWRLQVPNSCSIVPSGFTCRIQIQK